MVSDKIPKLQRSYSVEHILSLESFRIGNPIAVSTDGRWLAITVHNHRRQRVGSDEFLPSGFPSLLEGGEIWIVDVESGKRQNICLLYTSPSPRDGLLSRMPSSA